MACIVVDWSSAPEIQSATTPEEVANRERAEDFAQRTIELLTGRQIGGCEVVARPLLLNRTNLPTWNPATLYDTPSYGPYLSNGVWYNSCSDCVGQTCRCLSPKSIRLGGHPSRIVEVKINGAILDPSSYKLQDGKLFRIDGESWPARQDLRLPDSQDGTFSVTYIDGIELDANGRWCAGILAKEFYNSWQDDDQICRLPSSVISINRQGLAIELGKDLFPGGLTGIREVDLWIATWNPYRVRSKARVFSPDTMPQARRAQ